MKKVIICAGALLCGAAMFAQDNKVTGTQHDTGASTVDAYQAGKENNAAINQNDGTKLVSNSDQYGEGNKVVVDQTGTENTSDIIQEGGEVNFAKVDQMDLGNMSTIIQGTGMAAVNNRAVVTQSGSSDVSLGNESMITQTYDQSKAVVDQTGDQNMATVTQVGKPNQPGAPNMRFPRNEVDIDQIGERNTAITMQESYDVSMGKNWAKVYTEGSDNLAWVKQAATQENKASINQNSVFAEAFIEQTSDGNTATIDQKADDADLTAGTGDVAYVLQMGGTGNSALVKQESVEPYGNPGSYAYVEQDGSDNSVKVDHQSGRGQEAWVRQEGSDNSTKLNQGANSQYADILQMGAGNSVDLSQGIHQQDAWITQNGDGR